MVAEPLKRRLFLAVPLGEEARAVLAQGLPRLPGKVVTPLNWHFTTRFLGWVDELTEEKISSDLDQAHLGPGFDMELGEMGAFPQPARATVLWLGLTKGLSRLTELNAICEEAAQGAGLVAEDRPYSAHLTLSRIRPHQDVRPVIAAYVPIPTKWRADRLVLYQSTLGQGGAVYTELTDFRF